MNDQVRVLVRRLPGSEDLRLPVRATPHASGLDLRAAVEQAVELKPGDRALIPTGIALAIPAGYEGQVRPRSGAAWKGGLTVLNAPGTVDADYRGEVKVILINLGRKTTTVARGERIAQLVIQAVPDVEIREAPALPESERGVGGFGHTGNH